MEWWGVAATLFAAASLVAVIWQIARFEATQPSLGWELGHSMSHLIRNGRQDVQVTFRPIGPVVLHEVEAIDWGSARIPTVTERARMDCDSTPLVVDATWVPGKEGHVGVTWIQPSMIRRTPTRHAMRVRLADQVIERWYWYRIPRRGSRPQGQWRDWSHRQGRRTHVPDMWGAPGSK